MKIILLKNVPKVGKKDELVEVAEGYARNSLLPRGLAILADQKNITNLKNRIELAEHKKEDIEQIKKNNFLKLSKQIINIDVPHNDSGVLFKKITLRDIVKTIREKFYIEIEESDLDLDKIFIKNVGKYEIKSKTFPQLMFTININ